MALDQKADAMVNRTKSEQQKLDDLNLAADVTIGSALLIGLTTFILDAALSTGGSGRMVGETSTSPLRAGAAAR
jgi:hypothetical protein